MSEILEFESVGAGGMDEKARWAGVKGWDPLEWGMGLDGARKALAGAGVRFDERFMAKDGTTHVVFARADGWRAVVYFDAEGKMTQILFESPSLANEKDAIASVERLSARFGPPCETRPAAYSDATRTDTHHVWRNATTVLTVTVAHYLEADEWIVWEGYVPAE
ncbi:MAG: hypothetical protein HY720_20985 [Planctomycetes bacterium]|nr:hypothetical protein [Planctomycetota bacterium]